MPNNKPTKALYIMIENENRPTKKYNKDELPIELILNKDAKRGKFTLNQTVGFLALILFVIVGLTITLVGIGVIPESANGIDLVQTIQEFPKKMSIIFGIVLIFLAKVIWELIEQHRATDLIFAQVQEHMNFDIHNLGADKHIGIEYLEEENHFLVEIKSDL